MYSELIFANEERADESLQNASFRLAENRDIEFVIEAIIESEKSGANMIGTCLIFGITEAEYKNILKEVLLENFGDYEYMLAGFVIAELDGEYVGTSGSWIEALDGMPSGMMKTSILTPYLSCEKITDMKNNMHLINSLTISREPLSFQLEHIYIKEKFRKHGFFKSLIKENIKRNLNRYPFTKVQTILFEDNKASYCAHLKLGFEVLERKVEEDKDVLNYFPYNSKVLMELNHEKIQRLLVHL